MLINFLEFSPKQSATSKMAEYEQFEAKLLDFDDSNDEVDHITNGLDFQYQSNGLVYEKVTIITEEFEDQQPEVIVHIKSGSDEKEDRSTSPTIQLDPNSLKQIRRDWRNVIHAQRTSVPMDTNRSQSIGRYINQPKPTISYQSIDHPKSQVDNQPVKEDTIKPIVVLRQDLAESFLSLTSQDLSNDGIVWTPIPSLELQDDDHRYRHKPNDNVDRNSIIDNKDSTREFLMGKMLESIESETNYNTSRLTSVHSRSMPSLMATAIVTNGHVSDDSHLNHHYKPQQLQQQQQQQQQQTEISKTKETTVPMQLVSARPCFVVDNSFPTKVAEPGSKKTVAQISAEARIAKEIEEIQLREVELVRARGVVLPSTVEPEVSISKFADINRSPSPALSVDSDKIDYNDVMLPRFTDILVHQAPATHLAPAPQSPPPSPPPPMVSLATHPLSASSPTTPSTTSIERPVEKIKVRPLVEDSDDEQPSQRYKFYKETAVEREIRLATQREEDLRREKQQLIQKITPSIESKKVEIETQTKSVQLQSQLVVVSQPNMATVEAMAVPQTVMHAPPVKLNLSGPSPSSISRGYDNHYVAPAAPKFNNSAQEMEKKKIPEVIVETVVAEKVSPVFTQLNYDLENEIDFKVPSSAPPTSKTWSFPSPNFGAGPVKRPSFSGDRLPGTLPNRSSTKGIMAKFLANHGKPASVFVPKTTIPQVQPTYISNTLDSKSTNGHNGKTMDNEIENQNAKLQSPKVQYKRSLSSVQSKILDELREMQGREDELRKQRLSTHIDSTNEDQNIRINGAVNREVDISTGAWGIFNMINGGSNGHSEA